MEDNVRMFDIPMNSKGAMDLSAGLSANTSQAWNGDTVGNMAGNNSGNMAGNMAGNNSGNMAGNTGFNTVNPEFNSNVSTGATVQHYEHPSSGGVILKKGVKSKLAAMADGGQLHKVRVGLGWDVSGNTQYDLDSSCFMLGADKRVVGDDWFVFYNQQRSPDGAVVHFGDNKTGAGDGDDEVIDINLDALDPRVQRLVFVITIADGLENGYNFGCISNAFARIIDSVSGKELGIFNLTDYYDTVTAMVVFEIYKHNGEWKVNPVGNGLQKTGLLELCSFYGVHVQG